VGFNMGGDMTAERDGDYGVSEDVDVLLKAELRRMLICCIMGWRNGDIEHT
jgi:hypothetical protein